MSTTISRKVVDAPTLDGFDAGAAPEPRTIVTVTHDGAIAVEDDSLDVKQVVTLKDLAITMTKAGVSAKHVAERLKVQPRTVRAWLYAARREGLLGDVEVIERMKFRTDFLALEAIDAILEDESTPPETRLRAAQEHLKGKGYYQHHAAINQKVDGTIHTELKVSFETKSADGVPVDVVDGSVIGVPEDATPKALAPPIDDVDAIEGT